jgi:hypothetical protein
VRPRGRIDSVAAAVGEAAGALRRRREARRPYVKVYAEDGLARLLAPDSREGQALIDAAEAMVDAVDAGPQEAPEAGSG